MEAQKNKSVARMNIQNYESTQKSQFSAHSSTSCSPCFARTCGCGKQVILYKSNSKNNPGRLFWRCPDWKENGSCGFFEWEKGQAKDDMEGSCKVNEELNNEELKINDMMDKKIARLREDMEELVQSVMLNLRENKDEMKNKKIASLKLKLKKERLKSNMMLFLLVLGWALALVKYF